MPYKVLSTGEVREAAQPEGWGEFLGRKAVQAVPRAVSGAIGLPIGAAKLAGSILQPISNKLESYLPENKEIEELGRQLGLEKDSEKLELPNTEDIYKGQSQVLQKLGVPKKLLESKPGFLEGTLDRAVTALPWVYLMPGSLTANLTREVGASAAGQGAEELGAGPLGQLTASILGGWATGKGFNAVTNYLKKGGSIENLETLSETAKTNFYNKEKELGSKIQAPAREYESNLNKLYSEIVDDISLPTKSKKELINRFKKFEQDYATGKISASRLAERTKQINAAYPSITNPIEENYLRRAQKIMFDEGKRIGEIHPEWYNAWESARSIGRAQSYKVILPEILQDSPKLVKYLTNGTIRAILGLTGIKTSLNKGAQVIGFLNESRAGRDLLKKAMEYTVNRNIPALEKTYRELQKLTDKYEKENSVQRTPKGKYRIIKT